VTLQSYTPLNRLLRVTGVGGDEVLAFLGPRGQIEAGVVRHHDLAEADAPYLLRSARHVLGPRWQHLGGDEAHRGDRAALAQALEATGTPPHLPTDSPRRASLQRPQVALLIDSGIDPRLPGLRDRLNLAPLSLAMFLEDHAPFTPVSADPVRALLDLLDDDELEGRHGTRVASVVAADLPRLQLSLIRSLDVLGGEDTARLSQRWADFIARSRASVVNVSVTYSRLVADCAALFDPIFRGAPDVLFVVAAGNNGATNPVTTCPASLAHRYPNVLTVAGTDRSGRLLHPHSNRGIRVAKVAAPYEGVAAEAVGSLAMPVARLTPMSGTSLSAALVSNAALRLWARHPALTAPAVAGTLMRACRPQGLDVACGGGLDFRRLEGL
jgi:subtilisin family serine protease